MTSSQPLLDGNEDGRFFKPSLRVGHVFKIWKEAQTARGNSFNFFGNIELAQDGGFSEHEPKKLLYSMQYIKASMSVLFILMNAVYVNQSDLNCVFRGECMAHRGVESHVAMEATCIKFQISECQTVTCIDKLTEACKVAPQIPPPFLLTRWLLFNTAYAERIIATLEFVGLWWLIWRLVQCSLQATLGSIEVFRWVSVVQIFWEVVPSLASFSLMRLLYFVVPAVIGTEAYYVFTWGLERIKEDDAEKSRSILLMVRYVLSRLVYVIIGFDAFLVKFRLASSGVLYGDPGLSDVLHVLLFLYQVMGVVNLTWFVRQRLFLFIFGSEDGNMSNEQKAREIVWNAMVAQKVYSNMHIWDFLVVMLGFDDYDFQVLVMDEKKDREKFRPPWARLTMWWSSPGVPADQDVDSDAAKYPFQAQLLSWAIDRN